MSIRNTLLSRWKSDWDSVPRLAAIRAAVDRALDVHDDIRKQHATFTGDAKLTALGRQDALRQHIADKTAREIRYLGAAIDTIRTGLNAWRARLQPKQPDKTDAAAASMAAEVRGMIRGLSQTERMKTLLAEGVDPLLTTSVLGAPNVLSGITDETRSRIFAAHVQRTFPDQLAAIAEVEDAMEVLDASHRVALGAAKTAAEFPDDRTVADFIAGATKEKGKTIDAAAAQHFAGVAA